MDINVKKVEITFSGTCKKCSNKLREVKKTKNNDKSKST